jgi:glycosyltransferase involved in cell wall biosynthesis
MAFARTVPHALGALVNASPASLDSESVTVVIPAYNAAATIGETLESVRTQSHRALEIIVVDDGSNDATPDIVRRFASLDDRIRLLRQSNAGVAAARNAGIAAATADFIAPVDADDLWHPQKIEKQLMALKHRGPRAAVAYTWSLLIDPESRVTRNLTEFRHEGDVLKPLCLENFLGNGSSALIRRRAVLEVEGYDPSLRRRSAQGCEDWKLYLALAQRFEYALVPEYMTGYRKAPGNMSSDLLQMARSGEIVLGELLAQRRDLEARITEGLFKHYLWAYRESLANGRTADAKQLRTKLTRVSPYRAFMTFSYWPLRRAIKRMLVPAAAGPVDWWIGKSFSTVCRELSLRPTGAS